jgi:hypothetical protein
MFLSAASLKNSPFSKGTEGVMGVGDGVLAEEEATEVLGSLIDIN